MRVLRHWFGRVVNAVGAPALIRSTECHSRLGVPIAVRVGPLFTEIVVHNLRLLFHRATGRFDGVVIQRTDCSGAEDDTFSAPLRLQGRADSQEQVFDAGHGQHM